MKKTDKLKEEIEYVEKFIKYVQKGYGKKVCWHKNKKEFAPNCVNCQAQWTLGWLRDHLSLLEWDTK